MIFAFEDKNSYLNLNKNQTLECGLSRVCVSPFFNTITFTFTDRIYNIEMYIDDKGNENHRDIFNKDYGIRYLHIDEIGDNQKYIIPVGVHQSPYEWCGGGYGNSKLDHIFHNINTKYLKDLKRGNAYLLIDNSYEGYHFDWLFDYFHNGAIEYGFDPQQVIFISGNSILEDTLSEWKRVNNHKTSINVIGYSHFEHDIGRDTFRYSQYHDGIKNGYYKHVPPLPDYYDQLTYKKENLKDIKFFNFLNRRPRHHRLWMLSMMHEYNLEKDGIISANDSNDTDIRIDDRILHYEYRDRLKNILPKRLNGENNLRGDAAKFIHRTHEQHTLDSWITIVSEAQFEDSMKTIFLSEKLFKPISCSHPFIILGSKNYLKEIRKMGYKTFHPYIDETYDELSNIERIDAIINELIVKSSMTDDDKLQWFADMHKILKYNKMILWYNTHVGMPHGFNLLLKLVNDV